MSYDVNDTIAAVASAPGGAARGVVRISGADAVARLASCFTPAPASKPLTAIQHAPADSRIHSRCEAMDADSELTVPGDLLLWPTARSYTREPSAEFHTIGSPPLLAAVIEQLGRAGVRPAEPGEFTLRAFLAGRIDLDPSRGGARRDRRPRSRRFGRRARSACRRTVAAAASTARGIARRARGARGGARLCRRGHRVHQPRRASRPAGSRRRKSSRLRLPSFRRAT